jgi:hypothetical protein
VGYFSNGTEGLMYQEKYCFRCSYWNDEAGCPIWLLHELHVGEKKWQPTLDRLIPMVPKRLSGNITVKFSGECYTFSRRGRDFPIEKPLTPGQQRGLNEWRTRKASP